MMNQSGVTEKTEVQHNHNHQGNVYVSPHMRVDAPIRYARLQKLKELDKKVRLEDQILEAEISEVSTEVDDLDML